MVRSSSAGSFRGCPVSIGPVLTYIYVLFGLVAV
jgi:hypothetical protein